MSLAGDFSGARTLGLNGPHTGFGEWLHGVNAARKRDEKSPLLASSPAIGIRRQSQEVGRLPGVALEEMS
jgi:hypothetical protein